MNKKLIRLTENDLHKIVKESVNKILNETKKKDPMQQWFKDMDDIQKHRDNIVTMFAVANTSFLSGAH